MWFELECFRVLEEVGCSCVCCEVMSMQCRVQASVEVRVLGWWYFCEVHAVEVLEFDLVLDDCEGSG